MKIAILGASGAIGSWLSERLLKQGIQPRLIIRGSAGNRLARHTNLDLHRVRFLDTRALASALDGVDVVVNCVVEKSTALHEQDLVSMNAKIAESILRACEQAGVQRLLHLSSIVVLPPRVTASVLQHPRVYSKEKDWYTRAKIESEKVISAYQGPVEVSVIRPGIVYGPQIPWSTTAITLGKQNVLCMPERNVSLCHAVHVDDVTGLLLHLASSSEKPPKLLYAVHPEVISWAQFFSDHVSAVGAECLLSYHNQKILEHNTLIKDPTFRMRSFRWLTASPLLFEVLRNKTLFSSIRRLSFVFGLELPTITPQGAQLISRSKTNLWPSRFELQMYLTNAQIPSSQNGEDIGYHYHVSFAEGCENTAAWWKYETAQRGHWDEPTRRLFQQASETYL